MKRILTALSLTLLIAGLGLGCRKPKTADQTTSSAVLMATADKQMKQGKFNEARITLRHLEQYLPGSPGVPQGQAHAGRQLLLPGQPQLSRSRSGVHRAS